MYGLGLDPLPDCNHLEENAEGSILRLYLCIGGSHAGREAEILADRGNKFIAYTMPGWRPNKSAWTKMAVKVKEACNQLTANDVVVVHCLDKVSCIARRRRPAYLEV